MTHEYLRDEYRKRPDCWVVEFYAGEWREVVGRPAWVAGTTYRMKPVTPPGLPELPDAAYCYGPDEPGAVFLQGPLKRPHKVSGAKSWRLYKNTWEYNDKWPFICELPYMVCLSDSNAEQIIALNRGPKPIEPDVVDQLIDALRPALKARGWG